MTGYAAARGTRPHGSGLLGRLLVVGAGMLAAGFAGAPVAYMLWPLPAAIAPDAPSIPVTVGGVVFNVPPAAIRFKMQRRPGPHSRIDLSFVWPTLEPPDNRIKPSPTVPPSVTNRLFATIAAADSTLPPLERVKVIYPRYLEAAPVVRPDGLSVQGFRDRSPYQGEDLVFDPASTEHFLLRCTRPIGSTPAMCLHERRLAGADITIRFPRDWLADWRSVSNGIDRLIAGFRPAPAPG